jgi:KUP system potassium uptake protein
MNYPSLRRRDRAAVEHADGPSPHARRGSLGALVVGALGVVYGDIGTSPLYAIDQIFLGRAGVLPTPGGSCRFQSALRLSSS